MQVRLISFLSNRDVPASRGEQDTLRWANRGGVNRQFTPGRRPRSVAATRAYLTCVDGQRKYPTKWPAKMSLCIARDDNRCLLFDPISLHGRAQSFHVFLCHVPMDAEFPDDPSNRQPLRFAF